MKTNFVLICGAMLLMLHCTIAADQVPAGEVKIPIVKKHDGHEINCTVEAADSTSEAKTYKTVPVLLSLSNNASFLSVNCKDKADGTLDSYLLDPKTSPGADSEYQNDFPIFSVKGYNAKANVVIDPNYWALQNLTVVANCLNRPGWREEVIGLLGLGSGGDSVSHFKGLNKAFALSLISNSVEGDLVFNPNVTEAARGPVRHHLKASGDNWHVTGDTIFAVNNKTYDLKTVTMIFDLDVEDIVLPQAMYDDLITELSSYDIKRDERHAYAFNYTGNLTSPVLPTINITIGDQVLTLLPEDYVSGIVQIRIEIDAPTRSTYNLPFIKSYQNGYIIIGRRYLEKHFTVFDPISGQINMYDSDETIKLAKDEAERQAELAKQKAEKDKQEAADKAKRDQEEQDRVNKEAKDAHNRMIVRYMVTGAVILLLLTIVFCIWKKRKGAQLKDDLNNNSYQAVIEPKVT